MIARVHIKPKLGRIKLRKVNALQVQTLYRQKLDAGVSPRRVRYIHVTLHKALNQAVRWQLIPRNVVTSAEPPRVPKADIKPLKVEQVKALLRAAETQPKLYALYVLAVTTGMRQGELLGLNWDDVDLTTGTVQVRRTVFNGQINAPKTSSGRRTVKLSQTALEALRKHSERGQAVWVFPTRNDTPVGSWNLIHRSWYPLKEAAGLPKGTRFHDLRHTAATLLLHKNVNPKVVSEMLGHANVSITLDTYSHVLPNMQDGAAGAMDDTLS
jgi:integrase